MNPPPLTADSYATLSRLTIVGGNQRPACPASSEDRADLMERQLPRDKVFKQILFKTALAIASARECKRLEKNRNSENILMVQ